MNKRHFALLLAITLIVQGALLLSYPLGGGDDDQSAQRYLIDELVRGNLYIGNLRYNTGYPLFISPAAALARHFGRLEDRVILLVQVGLSSTLPFWVYDLVRRRRSSREALIVGLVVALDLYNLQWAHWSVPTWLVAFYLVVGLWLVNRAVQAERRAVAWMVAAGLVFGAASLARTEAALLAAVLGMSLLGLRSLAWRTRLLLIGVLGGTAAAVLGLYLVAIQHPSTGTWRMSCMTGIDLLFSAKLKNIPLTADNGPETQRLLRWLALEPLRPIPFTIDQYPLWRQPGPWVLPQEQADFFNQPARDPLPAVDTVLPGALVYYYGLCPTDALLRSAMQESMTAHPGRWLHEVALTARDILLYRHAGFVTNYLPRYRYLAFSPTGSRVLDALGFREARSRNAEEASQYGVGWFYTGQVVWQPGIWLYSHLLGGATWVYLLMPLALIWALCSREWLYTTAAVMLLAGVLAVAVLNTTQPRIYAAFYPLYTLLLGGLIAALLRWLGATRAAAAKL